ncbi:MAG: 50S ribosomal protein L16 [Candidatus Micrarchaeota archaeon]
MGIRPSKALRDPDKVAWTRFSKSKPKKSYIKAMPHRDLNTFRTGIKKEDYDATIDLVSTKDMIVRDNSIESSRQTLNKHLEKGLPGAYYFIVRTYPHHVIRENKMIAGAGADRLQKGMRQSFGRPTDRAARVMKGTAIFTVLTYKSNVPLVADAMARCKKKLCGFYKVVAA